MRPSQKRKWFDQKKPRKLFQDEYMGQSDKGKYAVGMIMRHKKNNYRCVIYGWDEIWKANPVI